MILPISLAVTVLNEEKRLPKCLTSVRDLVSEIVIVDCGSSDRTIEIARQFNAHIFFHEWLGHHKQKQIALEACTQPWVLILDADEELSTDAKESIQKIFNQKQKVIYSGFSFHRSIFFLGRWIKHGDWYPDTKLRLVRREQSLIQGNASHDKVTVRGKVKRLKGDILHNSFPTLQSYLNKIPDFANQFHKIQQEKGKKWSLFNNLFNPTWRFIRAYFLKCGFLDGFPGFWIAFATSFSVFFRYSRLYEIEKIENKNNHYERNHF